MSVYAKIITDDKRFERLITLELADRGVEIIDEIGSDYKHISKKNLFTLVDLEFCSEDDISDLCTYSNVIGFSHLYQDANNEILKSCYAILHRPFLIEELFSIIFSEGNLPSIKNNVQPKKPGKRQIQDKKAYLRVDHTSKKAIWGNDGIALTDSEYRVLSLLCEKRGETVKRSEISEILGSSDGNISDVYICMLRRKIDNKLGVKLIYTVRGEGYVLKN